MYAIDRIIECGKRALRMDFVKALPKPCRKLVCSPRPGKRCGDQQHVEDILQQLTHAKQPG